MSITEVQLTAKRHARTMSSRKKRLDRAQRAEDARREGRNRSSWLAELGKSQQNAARTMEDQHRQALESRRSKAAMPGHPPKGLINRVKSLFRRTP